MNLKFLPQKLAIISNSHWRQLALVFSVRIFKIINMRKKINVVRQKINTENSFWPKILTEWC